MKTHQVATNGFIADFFTEPSDRPRKAIIMLGGSDGGKSWSKIKKPITYLVKKGYALLSLAYFKGKGLPDSLEEIPLEYFEKAFNWLSDQKTVVPNQYAILGGSKGAEAGLLLASQYPQIRVVITYWQTSRGLSEQECKRIKQNNHPNSNKCWRKSSYDF